MADAGPSYSGHLGFSAIYRFRRVILLQKSDLGPPPVFTTDIGISILSHFPAWLSFVLGQLLHSRVFSGSSTSFSATVGYQYTGRSYPNGSLWHSGRIRHCSHRALSVKSSYWICSYCHCSWMFLHHESELDNGDMGAPPNRPRYGSWHCFDSPAARDPSFTSRV